MNESTFTSKLLGALRTHPALKDNAVIWKHANYFTRGVPDFSVTVGNYTRWWEVKRYGERPTKIQKYFLDRIGKDGAATITMSKDGRGALVSGREWAGYMTINELVEHIAAESVLR